MLCLCFSLPGILPAGSPLHGVPPDVGQEGHHALGVIGRVETAHGVHSQLIERVQGPLVQRQLIRKEKEFQPISRIYLSIMTWLSQLLYF